MAYQLDQHTVIRVARDYDSPVAPALHHQGLCVHSETALMVHVEVALPAVRHQDGLHNLGIVRGSVRRGLRANRPQTRATQNRRCYYAYSSQNSTHPFSSAFPVCFADPSLHRRESRFTRRQLTRRAPMICFSSKWAPATQGSHVLTLQTPAKLRSNRGIHHPDPFFLLSKTLSG